MISFPMPWYEQSVFYHIYPLGLTGAPRENPFGEPVHRLRELFPWIAHLKSLHCSALYIGPLFQSSTHGYDTADYRLLDTRLGTNEDLTDFVEACHQSGIRVILDAVFNHTGRDFFAFRDLKAHRENSRFLHWYRNVNFYGNNEYNDGFSYDNWGGYNLLCKLDLQNPEVRAYLLDTVRFWVEVFKIDGLRLDAADVLDFDFLRALRQTAEQVKPDFWLMGEVIHGDYLRWANENTLHSVTNYHLHKALYSGHNDHNYFEIAHTVRRQADMGLGSRVLLYNFVDNHDVERIYTKLRDKRHFLPVHVLLYTLPGIPSLYYGSEFGIEGRKERGSDDSLRPCLSLEEKTGSASPCLELIRALGKIHEGEPALWYGEYRELCLTTEKYAFARGDVLVTVNNAATPAFFDLALEGAWQGALSGERVESSGGHAHFQLPPCGGEIWIPAADGRPDYTPLDLPPAAAPEPPAPEDAVLPPRASGKNYEEMTVPELQAEVLAKLAANGPLTESMKQDVARNVYRDSLLNWVRSFR